MDTDVAWYPGSTIQWTSCVRSTFQIGHRQESTRRAKQVVKLISPLPLLSPSRETISSFISSFNILLFFLLHRLYRTHPNCFLSFFHFLNFILCHIIFFIKVSLCAKLFCYILEVQNMIKYSRKVLSQDQYSGFDLDLKSCFHFCIIRA
jgi:hypothetical protein